MRKLLWTVSDRLHDLRDHAEEWFFDHKNGLYGAAACRVMLGLALLLLLGGNFSTRNLWVGPASIWAEPSRAISNFPEIGILRDASPEIVALIYVAVFISTAALILGWHTRAALVLTLLGHIAILSQNPIVGGQGDNVIRLGLLWLLLVDSSRHWSMDNRRREAHADESAGKRKAPRLRTAVANSQDALPAWLSNGLHNIGLVGLGAQTILIYLVAGLSKVADSAWQHGNALYYTMQLPDFRPFPFLSDIFSSSEFLLALLTYGVLLTQLFFGPMLLNKHSRALVVFLAIVVNVFLGVVLGLPVSSLALIGVTAIFVSGSTYATVAEFVDDATTPARFWLADRFDDVLDKLDDVRGRRSKSAAEPD